MPSCTASLQRLIGRRQHSHVDRDVALAAQARELAILQNVQQLGLQRRMHLADFVQEKRAGVGQIELAELLPVGAGERAGLVAKQLALQQFVRNRRAVHLHERLVVAAGLRIDHARNNFLAGATLAANQHRRRGIGHLLDGVLHLFHLRGLVPNRPEKSRLRRTWSRSCVTSLREALLVQDLVDTQIELGGLKWLGQVIVRAQLGGA